MADEGPTQDELDKAKAYLKGSYALALRHLDARSRASSCRSSSTSSASTIRSGATRMIDAVTLADAKRVAKRLLDAGLLTVVVGRAQGLTKTN